MFDTWTTLALQEYLWTIIAFLGACLVFLLFVQGGQILSLLLSKNEEEKNIILDNSAKRYELTFTALVIFGGSMFAIFPLFYSTSFGGAYFVWFSLLFLFIFEAVSFKYRAKVSNFLGAKTYEILLFLNGVGAPFLLGVAIATFFTGANFTVEKVNMLNLGESGRAISQWHDAFHGYEALWNTSQAAFLTNISLGLTLIFLALVMALLNLYKNILLHPNSLPVGEVLFLERIKRVFPWISGIFLFFFLFFVARILMIDGFSYHPETKEVFIESYKYLNNFLEMPGLALMFTGGVGFVLAGTIAFQFWRYNRSFWIVGVGVIFVVESLLLSLGWNNTVYYPSLVDLQSSLTIENSSSSRYTLLVLAYSSLFMPFVLAYIAYVWKQITGVKIEH